MNKTKAKMLVHSTMEKQRYSSTSTYSNQIILFGGILVKYRCFLLGENTLKEKDKEKGSDMIADQALLRYI